MPEEAQIGPVPNAARSETIRFLAGGRRRDIPTAVRAEAIERMMTHCRPAPRLWWAHRGGQCVAAAVVIPAHGRVGMLSHSPVEAPGVDGRCLANVAGQVSREALDDGLAFVQSLLPPERQADREVLVLAGFQRLAELIYMRLDLSEPIRSGEEDAYTWRSYRAFSEMELAAVMAGTYEQSLDCPPLRGLRKVPDIIAGHKASGVFSPKSWWIAAVENQSAGCILVNDSAVSPGDMDIVYMGVVPAFRGRGLGRDMVRRAARWARQQKRGLLTVAVDASNPHAEKIYRGMGFRETSRRIAQILTARRRNMNGT